MFYLILFVGDLKVYMYKSLEEVANMDEILDPAIKAQNKICV